MATKTTNYNLTKPNGTESADISVINANMDIIDNALNDKASKSEIPDVSGFLPLTGGTLTGGLAIQEESSSGELFGNLTLGTGILMSDDAGMMLGYATQDESKGTMLFMGDGYIFAMGGSDDASFGSLVDLGDEVFSWGRIYGTTIYQNGEQVAVMSDIPNMSNYATKGEIPDVSGKANLTGNQEFKGQIRITRDNGNVPLFVRAPNSEEVNIGLTNSSGTGYFGVDANLNPVYMGNEEPDQIALMSDIPNMSNYATKTALNNKQDKLTAGEGITINNNVISANVPNITISSAEPSGGSHGDIWFKYSE